MQGLQAKKSGRTRRYSLVLAGLIVSILCLPAQTLNFRNITTDQGLPSNNCYSAIQDHDGFIWIATNAGIAKYNGSKFTNYQVSNGLTDNCIYNLYEDEYGRIFYNPANARVGYIQNGKMYIPPFSDSLCRATDNGIRYIWKIGEYDKDSLLICTQNGFYTVDKATLSDLRKLPHKGLSGFYIKIINNEAFGAVYSYVSQKDRENRHSNLFDLFIDYGTHEQHNQITLTGNFGYAILRPIYLSDGRLIIGFGNCVLTVWPDGRMISTPMGHTVNSVFRDSRNGVWVSTLTDGAYYYPDGDVTQVPQKFLSDAVTRTLMEDRDGGLWCMTSRRGIYYNTNRELVNYSNQPEMLRSFYSLFRLGSYMVLGGMSNTIILFRDKYHFQPVLINTTIHGVNNAVRYGDRVYMSGYKGSYITDTNFRIIQPICYDSYGNGSLLYNIQQTPDGQLWGVRWEALIRLDENLIGESIPLPGRGSDLAVDGRGNLYVSTNTGTYRFEQNKFLLVPGTRIKTNRLVKDPAGNVWACTDGAGLLELRNGRVNRHIGTANGLSSDICYDAAFGDDQVIWVAGNKGLNRVSRFGIQHYSIYDGLPSDEISHLEIMGNELYICTGKGPAVLTTNSIERNHPVPSVFLRSVMINEEQAAPRKAYRYFQNRVSFELEGLSFKDPAGLQYRYRLKGWDKTWLISPNEKIVYNSLPPGQYTFEAYVVSADGISSDEVVQFSFSIRVPVWRQSWFIILMAGLAMTLIYFLVRWRIQQIQAAEAEKNKLYQLVADSQLKALQSQMNPHFIFNAVNSIQAYILNNDKISAYEYLSKFSLLIRQMLQQSQYKTISLQQEVETLQLYLELEQKRFKHKFRFQITIDESLPLEEVQIPTHIIQPFVENAIWHGLMPLKERDPALSLTILKQEERIVITIRDNGIGREASAAAKTKSSHESMGIAMARERLMLLPDTLYEKAEIFIIDLRNTQGLPEGTEVTIQLYEKHT